MVGLAVGLAIGLAVPTVDAALPVASSRALRTEDLISESFCCGVSHCGISRCAVAFVTVEICVASDIRVSSDMHALFGMRALSGTIALFGLRVPPDTCVASDMRVASDIRVSSGRLSALAGAVMASSALSGMGPGVESGAEPRVGTGNRDKRGFDARGFAEKNDKMVSYSVIG
ncbi:hypothetical protein [Bifidobacterium erythrocebi]|uniref:hypothetical protein n=1 Tax=Bifidobacterium erythrocebi TaxID=2675325 RepID=UPI001F0E0F0D|nr:hypothetical protein [Bifidobacterium sp. DSM 109960]